jgi:tetratricopeptide (TPR) repeat protein/predicted aspartyl protease
MVTPVYAGNCQLGKLLEFPVTMNGPRPLVSATINDRKVQFVLDSGAFYSMITPASAEELKLITTFAAPRFTVLGVTGSTRVMLTRVKSLVLAGQQFPELTFLVAGSEPGEGSIGFLGQNFLHLADVDYDLANGVVRLIRAQNCHSDNLAYWVPAGGTYSMVDLDREEQGKSTDVNRHTVSVAYINGEKFKVLFDTGAPQSLLSLHAAARIGIRPDSPGVVPVGMMSGIGAKLVPEYIAPVSSFKIGDEEVRNTRIRVGDMVLEGADMLLGADFFLSHRIYVSNLQNKLYFTYNGGPIFNLSTGAKATAAPVTTSAAQGDGQGEDAEEISRRAAALASRGELDQALAAFSRAVELAPDNADSRYQRAMVFWRLRKPDEALADLDQALKIRPDDFRAHLSRGELLLQRGDKALATADLDAADAAAPKEADERLELANAYDRAGLLPQAVVQLTRWIDAHGVDRRIPEAYNSRCWIRALQGTELAQALSDCNAALKGTEKANPLYVEISDSRGLVYLRMGDPAKAIADYDTALGMNPKSAWSLYGRGIARLRTGMKAQGEADIDAATAIRASIADDFTRLGITP